MRTTAQLTTGSDPGSLGNAWTFTAGYYPRPTALVNSTNPSIPKAVALGAVPLYLADGDTAAKITKPFTVPMTTADGSPITWSASSSLLTVDSSGNVTVNGQGEVELTAEANGFKKTFLLGWGTDTGPEEPGDVWDGSVASGFDGGSGTQTDPYRIATGAQLARVGIVPTAGVYFIIVNDINLGNVRWTPIDYFLGNLDGAGYTVSNLYIDESNEVHIGFFRILDGSVQNLNLSGNLRGAGLLIGMLTGNNRGSIVNCMTSGSMSGEHPHTMLTDYFDEVKNTTIGYLDPASNIGGLTGYNNGVVSGSFSNCAILGYEEGVYIHPRENRTCYAEIGGLVSINHGTIESSASNTDVKFATPSDQVGTDIGGISGWTGLTVQNTQISNTAVYGTLTVEGGRAAYIGGLTADTPSSSNTTSIADVTNNVTTGRIKAVNTLTVTAGSITVSVETDKTTLSNNFYDYQSTSAPYSVVIVDENSSANDTTGSTTTAQLTSGSDPGSLGNAWTFTAGYYPRPTALVNSPNPSIQKAVALGAVPLNLADGDTVANITKSFTVPTTTADGSPITWSSSSPSLLTVDSSGNVTVVNADELKLAGAELTAEANGFKKTFVLGGSSSTDPIDPDGPTPPPLPTDPAEVVITNPDAQSHFDAVNGTLTSSGVHIELGNNQSPIDVTGTEWQLIDAIDNIAISVVDPSVIIPPDCYETLGKSGADIGIDVGSITSPGRSAIMPIMYSVTLSRRELDSLFGAAAANIMSKPYANLGTIFSRLVIQKEIIEGSETNMYANLVPNILKPADAVTKGIMRLYTNSGGLEIELSCYVLDAEYRNPYLHRDASGNEYLIIHDGAANGKISDPFWLHRYTGTNFASSGGGGGGCSTGMFSLVLLLAACKVRRRNR